MANTNLTIDQITQRSLMILHQKLNFVGNITRDYDDSFANTGAKIGDTLRVRLPLSYQTGTGAAIATGTGADTVGVSTTLPVQTQRNVPMRFTTKELTMDIDEFSSRHLEPAMAKLAAMIESDCLTQAYKVMPELHKSSTLATPVYKDIMEMRKILNDNLAPMDNRCLLLDTQCHVDLADAFKGLYNNTTQIGKQFLDGAITRVNGFDVYENTLIPVYTSGAEDTTDAAYDIAAGSDMEKTLSLTDSDPNTMTITVDTGTKTITAGQVFTIDSVFDVHPESKATLGHLKSFVVTGGDTGTATATSLVISPAIIASGPQQNCSAAAAENDDLVFQNADASTTFNQSLAFQKGFAVFATADLQMPDGVAMKSRQTYDGISMRILQDYSITNDRVYTRLDVLYGFKVIRPDLGVKLWHT